MTLSLFVSCEQEGDFDNKAYVVSPKLETIINKANSTSEVKTIQVGMSKPEALPITVQINVDGSLVDTYNTLYNDQAELLPQAHYELSSNQTVINTGAILSDQINVNFKSIGDLDREKVYVLPLRVNASQLEVLSSKNTAYYVIKGGALINVVANMNENFLNTTSFKTPAALNGLNDFTMEALIYPRELNKLISSVMGIEGYFLLRIGDAGVPPNRLQIASSSGNRVITKDIPLNTWTHIAVVYNRTDRVLKVYYDGEEVYNATSVNYSVLNMGNSGFNIGKSYDDNRSFNGEFSEFRIWNVARSQEDIKANPYEVPANSEGLVAYWRINDGNGSTVKDHTENGNDLNANKPLKWVPVELPAKGN